MNVKGNRRVLKPEGVPRAIDEYVKSTSRSIDKDA